MKLYPLKRVLNNSQIIFIDGITRTGKLLLGSLVSSMDKMEHLEFGEDFEFLLPALKLKRVKIDFVNAYLNNYLNQMIYNRFIGRKVNFRPSDRTGIANSRNPKVYYKRLKNKEGDSVFSSIKKNKVLLPLVTHDIAANLDLLFKMKMDFKIIEIIRNPVDTVYSWYKQGIGKRFGKDQRIFTLLINNKNIIDSWYGALDKHQNKNLNSCEKCVNYVLNLNYFSNKNLYKYQSKKNLFITSYEKLITQPEKELGQISKFLNTKTNKATTQLIKKEKLPIKHNINFDNKYKKKLDIIEKLISKNLFEKLINLEKQYKKNCYKLFDN